VSARCAPPSESARSLHLARAGSPQRSLRQDCVLYIRDMGLTTIIFVPFWTALYLARVLLTTH